MNSNGVIFDSIECSKQSDAVECRGNNAENCDFLLKSYDLRGGARDEEIEALKQAISMFSGAPFSSFLQTSNG